MSINISLVFRKSALIKRLGIYIIYWNHAAFNDTGFVPPTWNDGMFHYSNCERSELSSLINHSTRSGPGASLHMLMHQTHQSEGVYLILDPALFWGSWKYKYLKIASGPWQSAQKVSSLLFLKNLYLRAPYPSVTLSVPLPFKRGLHRWTLWHEGQEISPTFFSRPLSSNMGV